MYRNKIRDFTVLQKSKQIVKCLFHATTPIKGISSNLILLCISKGVGKLFRIVDAMVVLHADDEGCCVSLAVFCVHLRGLRSVPF